jgi:hypothetical protein
VAPHAVARDKSRLSLSEKGASVAKAGALTIKADLGRPARRWAKKNRRACIHSGLSRHLGWKGLGNNEAAGTRFAPGMVLAPHPGNGDHMAVTDMIEHIFSGPAIFFSILGVALIYFLYFRARMHTDTVLKELAEKSIAIPPEMFRKADTRDMRATYLARGAILISVGLATIVFFCAMISQTFGYDYSNWYIKANGLIPPPHYLPFLGAFPLFVGIACLLIGYLQRPHE